MNRCRLFSTVIMAGLIFLSVSSSLSAFDGYGNTSYLRTLNRSASVGTLDAMFFNPSGTVRLPDGMYIQSGLDFPIFFRTFSPSDEAIGLGLPGLSFGFTYKRAGSSVFVTILPSMSKGLSLRNYASAAGGTGGSNYFFNHLNYEITAGGAFSFNDAVAMSFGARLITDVDLASIKYPQEKYSSSIFNIGAAMHAGLLITPTPWFGMSINAHSGGFGAGKTFVKGGGASSTAEGRPQKGGSGLCGFPARVDLGFLFNVNDIMDLQLTGQMRIGLFENTPTGLSFDMGKISLGFSTGIGMDFKFSEKFILGFGILYSNDTTKDNKYYDKLEALNVLRLQSIAFGAGMSFGVGDSFGWSISAAYPLYFSTRNGFSVLSTNVAGNKVKVNDVYIGIGFDVKMKGLF